MLNLQPVADGLSGQTLTDSLLLKTFSQIHFRSKLQPFFSCSGSSPLLPMLSLPSLLILRQTHLYETVGKGREDGEGRQNRALDKNIEPLEKKK